jgi:hypothetical protein
LVNRSGNRPKLPSPKKILPGKSNSAKKEFTVGKNSNRGRILQW